MSVVLLLGSLGLQRDSAAAWIGDVLLNAAFLIIGLIVAVALVERWQEESDRRRWTNVNALIRKRAIRATMQILGGVLEAPEITAILSATEQEAVPTYPQLFVDSRLTSTLIEQRLVPLITRLADRAPLESWETQDRVVQWLGPTD